MRHCNRLDYILIPTNEKTLERQRNLSTAFTASQEQCHPENHVVWPPFQTPQLQAFRHFYIKLHSVPSLPLTSWLPPSAAPSSCSPYNVRHSHFHLYIWQESRVKNEQKNQFSFFLFFFIVWP